MLMQLCSLFILSGAVAQPHYPPKNFIVTLQVELKNTSYETSMVE